MSLQSYWKNVYDDLVAELAGSQKRSILKDFCTRKNKKGETQTFDAMGPSDSATKTAIASITDTRAYLDTITSPSVAQLIATLTPHMEVNRQRTQASSYEVKTGHVFRKEDEVAEEANNQSSVLKSLMSTIWNQEDGMVLAVLRAANQLRASTDGKTFANVAFPAGQVLGAAGEITSMTKDVFAAIRRVFESNWEMEDRIFVAISPVTKEELIVASGATIQNKDFVDKSTYFEKGLLPDIQGCNVVVHPDVADDEFLAWTPAGVVYNECSPLETKLGENAGGQFAINLMIREYLSSARIDDKLVVQGAITRAT